MKGARVSDSSMDAPTVREPSGTSISVIVCSCTLERWELLRQSLRSLVTQELMPVEVILCVDHNESMFQQCGDELAPLFANAPWTFRIIQNKYETRLGGARTTAVEVATGDIVAFLDDDARAAPSWLRQLAEVYQDSNVVAVGGAPLADYEVPRPRWIPFECNWVFGCAYRGLPEHRSPVGHLIGANMSIRRAALVSFGGFHSDNHDDMDLSQRTRRAFGRDAVVFEPAAIVHHFVPERRLSWSYFWRRCFFVNKGKVRALRDMGGAGDLRAEFHFVRRSLSRSLAAEAREFRRGDRYAPVRYAMLMTAIVLGAAGAVAGRLTPGGK